MCELSQHKSQSQFSEIMKIRMEGQVKLFNWVDLEPARREQLATNVNCRLLQHAELGVTVFSDS
jgi:hypothetical protein